MLGAQSDLENIEIENIVTDSRLSRENTLFIPIKGERTDGEKFIPSVYKNGGVSLASPEYNGDEKVIRVESTLKAYLKIASEYRKRFTPIVVGVTGSVGKTTTKDLISCVLGMKYNTLKTLGNRNNEIGMPETLLQMNSSHTAAVIEMGMCGFGEIEALSDAARPHIAIITKIGVSHIELLGSRENICKAKMEIVHGMDPNGVLILGDDDLLSKVSSEDAGVKVLHFGLSENNDAYATDIFQDGMSMNFTLNYGQTKYSAVIPSIGEHMVLDALGAFLVGICAGVEPEMCIEGIGEYSPSGMRQKVVFHGGFTVIEDCYNASPDSVKASLTALRDFPSKGKKIAVLGDMLELGEHSESSHYDVGKKAAQCHIDAVLCVGKYAKYICDGVGENAEITRIFENKDDLFAFLKKNIGHDDTVLFKASHGVHLEDIIKRVYEEC